uniref:Uncharacterized protein n=1 Tax=Psilocybe cubensis TaxID=181762 RepID=A0A8H7XQH4_PSICU
MFEPTHEQAMYKSLFPVTWKALSMPGTRSGRATVHYTGDTALLVPQTDRDGMIVSTNAKHCHIGQKCVMETDSHGKNFLTSAESGIPGNTQCQVNTSNASDVGFGVFNGNKGDVEAVIKWDKVR